MSQLLNFLRNIFGLPARPLEAVIAPELLYSWTNYGNGYANAGYWKDAYGVGCLQGTVTGGHANHVFTLPPGYRPPARVTNACSTVGNLFTNCYIDPDGKVFTTGGAIGVCLDGVTFRTT